MSPFKHSRALRIAVTLFVMVLGISTLGRPAPAAPLIVSFDGKGTAWAWDIGVMQAFLERAKPEAVQDTVFVGASSGSMLAAYFACKGLSPSSVAYAVEGFERFPRDFLDEDTTARAVKLFLGLSAEAKLEKLLPVLAEISENDTCITKYPVLVPTANLEVVEGRNDKPFSGVRTRTFDQKTYELSEGGRVLGKVCTYFVNDAMAKILERIPAAERLCDLRLIRTGKDLSDMMVASISEPTYFYPPKEADMTLLRSIFPLPAQRTYGGGFIMNTAVQDVKRALPDAYVLATGRVSYSRTQNRVMLNWFSFPMNRTLFDQRWWVDEQISPTLSGWAELYEKKVTQKDHVQAGYDMAIKCFNASLAGNACLPKLFTKPHFSTDAAGHDMTALRHRGLKPLLKPWPSAGHANHGEGQ